MDIRWRKFSHCLLTKMIVFIIAIACFTGALTMVINIGKETDGNFAVLFEESYYQGSDFLQDSHSAVESIRALLTEYKSEEHILAGGTLTKDELERASEELFADFQSSSKRYNPNLSQTENYEIFQEVYGEELAGLRAELIQQDLKDYQRTLGRLAQYKGLLYYAADGKNEFTNSPEKTKEYFLTFPAYLLFSSQDQLVQPAEIRENPRFQWLTSSQRELNPQEVIYLSFSDEFLYPRLEKWQQDRALLSDNINQLAGLLAGLAAAFVYLVAVVGRRPESEQIHFNWIDRIYNDFKLIICLVLMGIWAGAISQIFYIKTYQLVIPLTLIIAACGLILVLSLVKHLKNRTLVKHTLIYTVLAKLFGFVRDVYDSGSVGVKIVLIVIVYPLLVAATFFMFPITIGAAAWLALKKVKEFQAIKEGVRRVKEGELHHTITIPGRGELARLAGEINGITEGLHKAVANELKSERLKTELITNVSHDIRTPLTSIITYIDLLKNEKEPAKSAEYLQIIEQKADRLKTLTDDLFEAAKASSGNMPVNLEKIDLVSLITQGLGELDDKIQERRLEFRISYPQDKVLIQADGRLLWRALENLLSNIFKYAQEGSRVYLEILQTDSEATLQLKNISAFELNISAAELMERFKRGDESRTSQGSGLGLSIAKSLIELQKGRFRIEIDGDLFKAIIQMPK